MTTKLDGILAKTMASCVILVAWGLTSLAGEIERNKVESDQVSPVTLNADTLQLIDRMGSKIRQEISNPSSITRKVGSYLTGSQATVRKLIFDMGAFGPGYADYIYARGANQSADAGASWIICLGLMRDSRVHDTLRTVVEVASDPNLKALAVLALSKYQDTLDVPIFASALSDTNVVLMETDVATRDGKFHELVHIVGMVAVPALYELGYKPVPDSVRGGYKAVKIEK